MATKKHLRRTNASSTIYPPQEHSYVCLISEIVRFTATILCALAPLAGIAHAVWTLDEYVWYEILLYGVGSEILCLALISLLILVLKPSFFFSRLFFVRKVKASENQKSENELKRMVIPQLPQEELHPCTMNEFSKNYLLNIETLCEKRIELQKLRAKREAYAEWKWILAGFMAVSAVLLIWASIVAFALVFVFIMVFAAFLSVNPKRFNSRDDRYRRREKNESNKEDPLFIRLYECVEKRDEKAKKQMEQISREIREHELENERILRDHIEKSEIVNDTL